MSLLSHPPGYANWCILLLIPRFDVADECSHIIDIFIPRFTKIHATLNIQLTNWILWNGKFYYRDVIKITITRAKGEGNGHFYHIEVIDLPFHTIPLVSCFISLIENMKKINFYWKFTSKFGIIFMLQSLLGSLFLALRTALALMRSCARSQELCERTMTMEGAYQVKITLQSRAPNVDSNSLT